MFNVAIMMTTHNQFQIRFFFFCSACFHFPKVKWKKKVKLKEILHLFSYKKRASVNNICFALCCVCVVCCVFVWRCTTFRKMAHWFVYDATVQCIEQQTIIYWSINWSIESSFIAISVLCLVEEKHRHQWTLQS